MGFSDDIVQLTAVHCHYAGFALPIVAGFVAQRLGRTLLLPLAVVVALPLTALGFTIGGTPKWLAATFMALTGLATATLLLRLGLREDAVARSLLSFAGLCLMVGMGLAIGWSWSLQFGWNFLALDSMAAIHGSLNALGFGLIGLIGLNILDLHDSKHGQVNLHPGRPSADMLQQFAIDARSQEPSNPPGLLGRTPPGGFKHQTWSRTIEHGDFDMACDALREWRGHQAAGIKIWPRQPYIKVGTTLGLAICAGPISLSATCRIVAVIDEAHRFGFAYATLAHHPEDGEESFVIARTASGELEITVTAVWRRSTLANYLFPPVTRLLQNRAIERYLDGIAAPVASPNRNSHAR